MRLEVYLNARGERRFVGLLEERGGDILFEYDKRFLDSGIELSPFLLPLRPGVASDPKRTFDGLFGVFNDSLPDGWGLLLLDRLLRRSGLPLERITPLSRLSLVGSGGMGALEYEPVTPDPEPLPERIDLDGVAEEAWRTLNEDPLPVETLRTLMALNGSSCGARPKIMVRVSGDRRLIVPAAVAEPGCDPWLIKFPARHDDPAIGRMEYACSLAAKRAGIEMPETALFPGRDGAAYFGVRRFDREDGGKVHVHTACGLLHASHRYASLDYENLFRLENPSPAIPRTWKSWSGSWRSTSGSAIRTTIPRTSPSSSMRKAAGGWPRPMTSPPRGAWGGNRPAWSTARGGTSRTRT